MHSDATESTTHEDNRPLSRWTMVNWSFVGTLATVALLGGVWRSPSALMVLLMACWPFAWLGFMGLMVTVWWRTGRVWTGLWPLGAMMVLGLSQYGSVLTGRLVASQGDVTLLTYNIQRLWGGPSGQSATDCVRQVITETAPDIVVLLEVEHRQLGQLFTDADERCRHTNYYGGESKKQGGVAVCVAAGGSLVITKVEDSHYTDDDGWRYLFVEVSDGEHHLNVIAVHLDPFRVSRNTPSSTELTSVAVSQGDQAVALLSRVAKLRDPTLLAGDFNSTAEFSIHTNLRRYLSDAWREAGWGFGPTADLFGFLPLRVDFVYTTSDLQATKMLVLPADCADHRPLITQIDRFTG